MSRKPTTETRQRESSLDVSLDDLNRLSSETVALVTNYFTTVSERRVFPDISGGELTSRLGSALPLDGEEVEKLIDECREIIEGSRHNGHPRFSAYVASPSTPAGAFADLITSALNPSVTSWRSSPAATELEWLVVRWIGSLIGYGEDVHGLLTSGGSMANLLAILIAHRSKSEGSPANEGLWDNRIPMTIYASEEVHMSIPKAADILGIGRHQVRPIETDNRFRIDTRSLRRSIETDIANGLKPFCVVASAGTVNTGAVDPLAELAQIAREFELWFHVDGAYGAPATMDSTKRSLFTGIAQADSVSLDPHKWLYTPVDCGCLLFRDEAVARKAFSANEADYIKVHEQSELESFAFWDYGVELSRRFRALKVWFTLKYYGVRRLAETISEDNRLAQYLASRIEDAEDFELLAPVELSICCFRFVPANIRPMLASATDKEAEELNVKLDDLNSRIMHSVQRGGRAYFSNASLHGRFALRVCIVNFRTTKSDLDEILEVIRKTGNEYVEVWK